MEAQPDVSVDYVEVVDADLFPARLKACAARVCCWQRGWGRHG